MKRVIGGAALLVFGMGIAFAGEMPAGWTPPKPSAELSQIKSLEGRWEGAGMDHLKEGEKTVVEYHVTSAGTAVEEHVAPGTSHEMISVYRDINGKLSMTHYCAMGNQPELELKSAANGKITLGESAASQAALAGQMRMNGLTIEQPDKDTLVETWTAVNADGTPGKSPTTFTLHKA